MRTEELIRQLAADAMPVTPLPPIARRVGTWLAIAVLSAVIVVLLLGVRRQLGDSVDRANFIFEALLLIVTGVSAGSAALVVSVPGAQRSGVVRWGPIVAGIACVTWAAGELAFAAATGAPTGRLAFAWHCVARTLSVAAIPGLLLFVMVRRAAPTHGAWAGLLAILATTSFGVFGANLICPNDRPLHLLLWHFLPLIGFAAAGAALGAWLLRWPALRR